MNYTAIKTNFAHAIGQQVTATVSGVMNKLRRAHQYRVTLAELQRLDDRELNDLNLSYADLPSVALNAVYNR